MLDELLHDPRFAIYRLIKSPGFTGLVVLSLGLGVGANASMFSLANSTLWTPMAVPDADEIVRIYEVRESSTQVSFPNYRDIVEEVDLFGGALLYRLESFGLVSDQLSQLVHGEIVTGNYFDVLGIEPEAGRFFDAAQYGAPESPLVAVMPNVDELFPFGLIRHDRLSSPEGRPDRIRKSRPLNNFNQIDRDTSRSRVAAKRYNGTRVRSTKNGLVSLDRHSVVSMISVPDRPRGISSAGRAQHWQC